MKLRKRGGSGLPGFRAYALLWTLVLLGLRALGAGPEILDIRLEADGRARVRVATETNSYYLLLRGGEVRQIILPRDIRLGQTLEITLTDPVPLPEAAFYRIEQIPVVTPRDTDGDGLDDVFELRHPGACNPLVADAALDPDGDGRTNLEEFVLGTNPAMANLVPQVSLLSPTIGAVLTLPGSFPLLAEALDLDGIVTSVEFTGNGTFLGRATNLPFGLSWTNAPAGTNLLVAIAADNFGSRATSAPVQVTVVFPGGSPRFGSLTDRSVDPSNPLRFYLTASDPDTPIPALTFGLVTGPDGLTVAPNGLVTWIPEPHQIPSTNQVVVRVGDGQSIVTGSFAVLARPAESRPVVRLAEPLGSVAYPAPGSVKLVAEARSTNAAIARVDFLAGTNLVGSVNAPPYRFDWNAVPPGEYVITVRAIDTQGVAATNGVPTLVRVTSVETEPLTTLASSPSAGETGVAVTRETVLRFSCPLRENAALTPDRFHAVAAGRRALARIELSTDRSTATLFYLENLPASSRVRVTFDGNGVFDCLGRELDADGELYQHHIGTACSNSDQHDMNKGYGLFDVACTVKSHVAYAM